MDAFIARGYVEGGIICTPRKQCIDVGALPPIVRTLLITDGTVTKVLEAFFWEPVNVSAVRQNLITDHPPVNDLGMAACEPCLRREVELRGERSGQVYGYASSLLRTHLLPEDVTQALVSGRIGIGQLLRTRGLETYREIIDLFEENRDSPTGTVGRTYRIYLHDQPAILVTETFPLARYADAR